MDAVTGADFRTNGDHPWSRDYIRIVSWNVERGLQFSAILDFLRRVDADLILLQEVDLKARRTNYRDVACELARSLHLNYLFGKEFQELSQGSGSSPAHHGLATLSPWPLSNGRIIHFQHQSNFWRPRWFIPQIEPFQRRLGGRIALAAAAIVHDRRIVVYNLHLESRGADILRLQQLRETLQDARQYTESSLVMLGGDFNLNAAGGDAAALLQSNEFHDAVRRPDVQTGASCWFFQHARPIDWIYITGGVKSEGHVHTDIHASDHHPVSAVFWPGDCNVLRGEPQSTGSRRGD
jgi:endonuclease/exonuclease/phosphatase family metal-dependent hydrolase